MSSLQFPTDVASSLLAKSGLKLRSIEVLQPLWAGYGFICHLTATVHPSSASGPNSPLTSDVNSEVSTPENIQHFILKLITPPQARVLDEGHIRKILSYSVEQHFYTHMAPLLPLDIPTANCFASIHEPNPNGTYTTAMILNDLRQTFPIAGEDQDVLNTNQVLAALEWLSSFHGFWWPRVKDLARNSLVQPPLIEANRKGKDGNPHERTVWLNGGYTYLATRRSEFSSLGRNQASEWSKLLTSEAGNGSSVAEVVASAVSPSENWRARNEDYITLIHGDVKSENMFISDDGKKVTFYDFQYVGLGLGVCDLAKLFTCSVPVEMLVGQKDIGRYLAMQEPERKLLEHYLKTLKKVSDKEYMWDTFIRHWETALVDWLRFQASWGFWGNTEWLEARVRHILKDEEWRRDVISGT